MQVADRMNSIPFSEIRQIFEEITRREQAGEKIIHLNIGRPDFDTPAHIKEAAKKAIDEGKVHYASNWGIPELREAISQKLQQDNDLSFDPANEIIVTVGANEAILIAMMGLLNPGDEILIPDPCWLHYFYCAQMAEAVPVSVPMKAENGFIPLIDDFKSRLTEKTKMIVITTPNNPTGSVFSEESLQEIAQLALDNDLFVLSDEIYEKMVYDGKRHVSIGSLRGMRERTLTVNGFSKAYSMTGWRLGWVAADKELASALIRIHQYTTVCTTTFAQWGAVEALTGSQAELSKMVKEFDRRRNLVFNALESMPGISTNKPEGAFYIFPNIKELGRTAEEITRYLLDEAKIAVVPGPVFGDYANDYIRLSYANSYENLELAMESMADALRKI